MRPGRVVTGTTGHQCGYIDLTITRLLLGRISRNAKFYHQVVHNVSEYEGRADVGDPGERKKKTSADRFVRFLTPTVNMPKQIREVSILVFVVRVSRNPLSLPRSSFLHHNDTLIRTSYWRHSPPWSHPKSLLRRLPRFVSARPRSTRMVPARKNGSPSGIVISTIDGNSFTATSGRVSWTEFGGHRVFDRR